MRRNLVRTLVGIGFALVLTACHQNGTVFATDTTDDTVDVVPGDGLCADAFGECSLRAAVMEANALPGVEEITLIAGDVHLLHTGLRIDEAVVVTGDATIESAAVVGITAAAVGGLVEFDGPDFFGGNTSLIVETGAHLLVRHSEFEQMNEAIRVNGGDLIMLASTIDAPRDGVTVDLDGTAFLENVTISGRRDVITARRGGEVMVRSSTLLGGRVNVSADATMLVESSIVSARCLSEDFTSLGYNVGSAWPFGACELDQPSDSFEREYVTVGGLADNGGPVRTVLPSPFGPAIDHGPSTNCTSTDDDARGVDRPFALRCDSGAVEFEYGTDCATPGPGADLRFCDYTDVDLSGLDLTGADARGARLAGATVTDATLVDVDFRGAEFGSTRFDRSDLTDADLTDSIGVYYADDANLTRANIAGTTLGTADRANFTDANARSIGFLFTSGSLVEAHIEGADFTDAYFWGVRSGGVTGEATFSPGVGVVAGHIVAPGVRLSGLDLVGEDFGDISIVNVAIENSAMTAAVISADSSGANLTGSTLDRATLRGIDISYSRFDSAILVETDLSDTDLYGSRFSGALLVRTDFSGANLRFVRFDGATMVDAIFDGTICPSGVNSDDNSGNCDGQWYAGWGPLS
ncbi:MAG: pentapeptide repeat-containing protein [Actinomycetota bacterium]